MIDFVIKCEQVVILFSGCWVSVLSTLICSVNFWKAFLVSAQKSVTIIDNLFFNAVRENKIDVINRSVNLCITYWLLQRKIRENFRWTRLPCWRMRWRGWGTLSPPYTPTCPTLTTVCWQVTSNSSLHYWPVKGWIQRRMVGVDYLVYSRIQNSMFNYSFLVILK